MLEVEVSALRSESPERNTTPNGDTAILCSELEIALRGSHSGEFERACTELRSTISIAAIHKVEIARLNAFIRNMAAECRATVTHHSPFSVLRGVFSHQTGETEAQAATRFVRHDVWQECQALEGLEGGAMVSTRCDNAGGRAHADALTCRWPRGHRSCDAQDNRSCSRRWVDWSMTARSSVL